MHIQLSRSDILVLNMTLSVC